MKMKWIMAVAVVGSLLTSCSKESENQIMGNATTTTTETNSQSKLSGDYRIQRASNNGDDITGNFRSYVFRFQRDNTVIVRTGDRVYHGKYQMEDNQLRMEFPKIKRLMNLSETFNYAVGKGSTFTLKSADMDRNLRFDFVKMVVDSQPVEPAQ